MPSLIPPSSSQTLVASLIPSRQAEEFSLGNLTYQDESPKTPGIKNIPMKHPSLCEARGQQKPSPLYIRRAI